jgi:hypothetical protein
LGKSDIIKTFGFWGKKRILLMQQEFLTAIMGLSHFPSI